LVVILSNRAYFTHMTIVRRRIKGDRSASVPRKSRNAPLRFSPANSSTPNPIGSRGRRDGRTSPLADALSSLPGDPGNRRLRVRLIAPSSIGAQPLRAA
jgi:hypothetical protein